MIDQNGSEKTVIGFRVLSFLFRNANTRDTISSETSGVEFTEVNTVLTANEISAIGFKVVTGPNLEGTATIIKRVALVIDKVSCDTA